MKKQSNPAPTGKRPKPKPNPAPPKKEFQLRRFMQIDNDPVVETFYMYKDFYQYKKQFPKKGDCVVLTEKEFWSWTKIAFKAGRQIKI